MNVNELMQRIANIQDGYVRCISDPDRPQQQVDGLKKAFVSFIDHVIALTSKETIALEVGKLVRKRALLRKQLE